jgi:hypothetical protein
VLAAKRPASSKSAIEETNKGGRSPQKLRAGYPVGAGVNETPAIVFGSTKQDPHQKAAFTRATGGCPLAFPPLALIYSGLAALKTEDFAE